MLQLTTVLFLIAGSILAVVHAIAMKLYLYWNLWWFDLPMHFLGGIVVALLVFTLKDLRLVSRQLLKPFKVIIIVFLVAVTWELYELWAGTLMESNYIFDTALDLIMGLLGGIVGYLVANSIRRLT